MIRSKEEFLKLRYSENIEEQHRATYEEASQEVWMEIIKQHPDSIEWVIHNKTIQIEILEELSLDSNPDVRSEVARKRKINNKIIDRLKNDSDETVRYSLLCNTKLSLEQKREICVDDSEWLRIKKHEVLK